MSSIIGDSFVVLPPNSTDKSIIFGRNSEDSQTEEGEAQEVYFHEAGEAVEGKSDGGAEPDEAGETFRLILQKPRPGVWGGDFGANDRNICMGIAWSSDDAESGSGSLCATDLLRYVLATSSSAASATERAGTLVEAHGADNAKLSFIICDPTEAWVFSSGGKLWAAQRLTEGFHRFPVNGLSVTTTIDKSSAELGDSLKSLGLWNGEGDLNFASCFGSSDSSTAWSGDEPAGDGSYSLTSMFDTLRSAARGQSSRSATVSALNPNGISCHWFTATPNATESVFKPFVFAPNPKISPLTKVPDDDNAITLLHKLHSQRKPSAVEDLKALESSCVDEMNKYLAEHPTADEELDELMKDCVEAEVKFYR